MTALTTYDPNHAGSLKTYHVLEVTLLRWDYKRVLTVEVGGNCLGFEIFSAAISIIYDDELPCADPPYVELTNPDGDTLMVEDLEGRGEEFLHPLVVGIRCVAVRTEGKG